MICGWFGLALWDAPPREQQAADLGPGGGEYHISNRLKKRQLATLH
jgi:hypothetical protein